MLQYSKKDSLETLDFISDTHFEFYDQHSFNQKVKDIFINRCSNKLIIAGDFCQVDKWCKNDLNKIFSQYEQVYYLFGNHEFYNTNIFEIDKNIEYLDSKYKNVKLIPSNHYCEEENILFFTNWHEPIYKDTHNIADSRFIVSYVEHVKEMRTREDTFLSEIIKRDIKPKYIVTHYLPFEESVSTRFKTSSINKFFLSDRSLEIEILRPKIVIHGHTHDEKNYIKKYKNSNLSVAVRCNPIGYPMERERYGAETNNYVRHIFK